jgi:hypothetical protein
MTLIPYNPFPTLHSGTNLLYYKAAHHTEDKGRITELQENVTSHRQQLTEQKHLNSVHISHCTCHEHVHFMKTAR